MLNLLMALLPGSIHAWVRRLRGQQIHHSARLSFGVVLQAESIQIGPGAHIRSLVRIRAKRFSLGTDSTVGPITLIAAHEISIGAHSGVSPITVISGDPGQPRSVFVMGDHTRIFPFCWLEPGHGIRLGDRVGVGGHGLIFTHGSWANYFRGAPVSFGPVVIEDGVWLPWRVFVMPNVVIGAHAIIGAGSVITRDVPAHALAAGSPAKVVRPQSYTQLDASALKERIEQAVAVFRAENPAYEASRIAVSTQAPKVTADKPAQVMVVAGINSEQGRSLWMQGNSIIDVIQETAWFANGDPVAPALATWLSRYGVRVDVQS